MRRCVASLKTIPPGSANDCNLAAKFTVSLIAGTAELSPVSTAPNKTRCHRPYRDERAAAPTIRVMSRRGIPKQLQAVFVSAFSHCHAFLQAVVSW
jgi:hypothetical protein